MVLFLRNHEIRGLMNLPEYIAAVEDGYREIGMGARRRLPARKPLDPRRQGR